MNKEILDYSLCKRLYDAGVRVDTENEWRIHGQYLDGSYTNPFLQETKKEEGKAYLDVVPLIIIPALTIVDGLELMKDKIFGLDTIKTENIRWSLILNSMRTFRGSLKEYVEQSLLYLLDNNAIGQNTKN